MRKLGSRNVVIFVLCVFVIGLSINCTTTKHITRYKTDGTPYTQDIVETEWVGTVAWIIIGIWVFGAMIADSDSDDDDY